MGVEVGTEPNMEVGHLWPMKGRHETIMPLRSSVVRLVMGHPRKHTPCVRLKGAEETDFMIVVRSGEKGLHKFPLVGGFSEEWLDIPVDELDVLELILSVERKGEVVGHAAVLGVELSDQQGVINKALTSPEGVVGTITMDYLFMSHLKIAADADYISGISDVKAPRLAGHRGSGAKGTAPLMENTVLSFISATRTAAVSHVELDVQITREGTPVIYHDFHLKVKRNQKVAQMGIPIYSLSIGEWMQRDAPVAYDDGDGLRSIRNVTAIGHEKGSLKDFMPTLAEVCKECPSDVGMMIELKYPIPEFQDTYKLPFPSRDYFANCVLSAVLSERNNDSRSIIFLTFDADLAMLLKSKQCRYPVYFLCAERSENLTDQYDTRCAVGENAVSFAKSVGLDGNVFALSVLMGKRHLVEHAHSNGLSVMTYGRMNSDPDIVREQFSMGVNGVIADNVNLLVTKLEMEKGAVREKPTSDIFTERAQARKL